MNIGTAQLQAPVNNIPSAVIDVDMEDDKGSNWELGSGVDSEEGGGVVTEAVEEAEEL